MSNDYFVNRQDRYFLIRDCEQLCDFFESVIDSLSSFSFKVNKQGEAEYLNKNDLQHPFNGHYDEFTKGLSEKLNDVIEGHKKLKNINNYNSSNEADLAYIYPLIQMYDCNIKVDELITKNLFSMAPSSSYLYLAVGYFNLTNEYIQSIVEQSRANFNILLSSPEANGFFGAEGFSNNIPKIYSFLEEEFLKLCSNLRQEKRINLHEYQRNQWSI